MPAINYQAVSLLGFLANETNLIFVNTYNYAFKLTCKTLLLYLKFEKFVCGCFVNLLYTVFCPYFIDFISEKLVSLLWSVRVLHP